MKTALILSLVLFFTLSARALEALPSKPPIPADNPLSSAKIELGKQLYFDPRLSKDGTISCNSCHNVMAGGEDGRPNSVGIQGQRGGRSAPTVWNAAFLSVQFWDGRRNTLEDQAKGPLTNPIEMGMESHDAVMARIQKIPGYVEGFKKAFPKEPGPTIDQLAKAIASYERTLITGGSPYDQYLKGDKKALSASAVRGMELVQSVGCTSCHSGPVFAGPPLPVGTGFFQKFPMFPGSDFDRKYELTKDLGRFEVTKNEADRNMFRVPTWRNVAVTAPYFHNGKVKTLDEAIRVMAKTQLNKELKEGEVKDIQSFLESLTGKFPEQKMPRLPATPGESLVSD
jgi:cytochrome c peroxidase